MGICPLRSSGDMVIPGVMLEHLQHCGDGSLFHLCRNCWFLNILNVRPSLLLSVDYSKALVSHQWRASTRKQIQENWHRQLIAPQHFTWGYFGAVQPRKGLKVAGSLFLVNYFHSLLKTGTENGQEQRVRACCASCTCTKPFPILSPVFPLCFITWWVWC